MNQADIENENSKNIGKLLSTLSYLSPDEFQNQGIYDKIDEYFRVRFRKIQDADVVEMVKVIDEN